jgi:transposase
MVESGDRGTTEEWGGVTMQIVYDSCAGMDVHAKTVVVCVIVRGQKEVRTFSTMTDDLLQLADWLVEKKCAQVAIESTGVYWKPVFNILEAVVDVILVNAHDVKAVPGRKTDVRDCEWLADLLRHGLLKASFIPPTHIRELRELTRYRQSLVKEQTAVANRIQKLIESCNIKLGQVASDVLGVSGRAILRALASGQEDVTQMEQLVRGRLKQKTREINRALHGSLSPTQRTLDSYRAAGPQGIEAALARVGQRIREHIEASPDPFVAQAGEMLVTIPGIGEQVAQSLIAEIGVDMQRFPTDAHLASWCGLCPGNNESAGKRRSGKTTKGNPYVRTALVQAAWAASHTKNSYLSAQFHRLVKRLGRKKALVAVAHSIVVIVYHLLAQKSTYEDLGADYFDRRAAEVQGKRLVKRLEALGFKVTVEPLPLAA